MTNSLIITDNHMHVGWYSDGYHSPEEIWNIAKCSGIKELVVSSTTTCAYQCLPRLIIREFKGLIRLGGESIHPILWMRPDYFKTNNKYVLPTLLRSKVQWQGIKLHFEAHPEWFTRSDLVDKAINVAKQLSVPVLLHSGGPHSDALVFERYINANENISFILAHGCPPQDTSYLLGRYSNLFIDTAAMVNEIIQYYIENGHSNRMLFGTDTALCSHIEGVDMQIEYIKSKIAFIKGICTESEFYSLMSRCIYAKNN